MKAYFLGPLAAVLVYFLPFADLSWQGQACLSLTVLMAIWWITECLPLGITALLPLILLPFLGVQDLKSVGQSYADPIIFLFLGGFMLAMSIERWGLHRRVALNVIVWVGGSLPRIILGFMLATAILSMWISNTATTLMMLPIAQALISQVGLGEGGAHLRDSFAKALLLGIAYSASIGGIATLIGTPTNAIMAGMVLDLLKIEIGFAWWLMVFAPVSFLLLWFCWYYLTRLAFPACCQAGFDVGAKGQALAERRKALGKMSVEEKRVALVFGLVAILWIFRPLFELYLGSGRLSDAGSALLGALILFVLPASNRDERLLNWPTAARLPWDILLLFGGGFALASAFKTSGLSDWIGLKLQFLSVFPYFVLLILLIAAINFLTEVTSNVATVSMILPILAALAKNLDLSPLPLMIGATCAASCAFMLPIATAPNAIVFGSGALRMKDMAQVGLVLNLVSVLLFSIWIYLFVT